jgi:hypothetical protein
MKMEDLTTKRYDRRSGVYCQQVIDHLTANGVEDPQVLKMNAWGGSPGLWAVTVYNADADRLDALMAEFMASLDFGIDSTGQRFAYDTQPLPLLNPGLDA